MKGQIKSRRMSKIHDKLITAPFFLIIIIKILKILFFTIFLQKILRNRQKSNFHNNFKLEPVTWIPISSTGKIYDSYIKDLGFNPCLHQNLIDVANCLFHP